MDQDIPIRLFAFPKAKCHLPHTYNAIAHLLQSNTQRHKPIIFLSVANDNLQYKDFHQAVATFQLFQLVLT